MNYHAMARITFQFLHQIGKLAGLSLLVAAIMVSAHIGAIGDETAKAPKADAVEVIEHAGAAESATEATKVVELDGEQLIGNWTYYGYRLNRTETNQIANLSVWSAFGGVSSSGLIPLSSWIMRAYSVGWIYAARNARAMGQCLAISYAGVGLIVGCPW